MEYFKRVKETSIRLLLAGLIGLCFSISVLFKLLKLLNEPASTIIDIEYFVIYDIILVSLISIVFSVYVVCGWLYPRLHPWTWRTIYWTNLIGLIVTLIFIMRYITTMHNITIIVIGIFVVFGLLVHLHIRKIETKAMFKIWRERWRERFPGL